MCAFGDKNIKQQQQKQQHINHNFEGLYSMLVNHHTCVVLRYGVPHIDSWNCSKLMHIYIYKHT